LHSTDPQAVHIRSGNRLLERGRNTPIEWNSGSVCLVRSVVLESRFLSSSTNIDMTGVLGDMFPTAPKERKE